MVATTVIALGAVVVKRVGEQKRARETRANEAKEELRAIAGEHTDSDGADPEHGPYGLVELDRYGVPATLTDGGEAVGFDA